MGQGHAAASGIMVELLAAVPGHDRNGEKTQGNGRRHLRHVQYHAALYVKGASRGQSGRYFQNGRKPARLYGLTEEQIAELVRRSSEENEAAAKAAN